MPASGSRCQRRDETVDNTPDVIRCGVAFQDVLNRELQDVDATGCETVNSVGRLTAKGGKVTARLALELERELAGRRLKADVVAVDVHRTRQVERGAATIRVAR